MAKQDSLFLLIKALNKAEKRHFKVDAARFQSKGNKDYLRLFDAIDAQKIYDESFLRKKFRNEPYFNQLGCVKLYLQRQIMKSLRNFHEADSSFIKLNNYLTEIDILFKKELFRECLSTIKKAKIYARKYEKFPKLLELIEWEIQLAGYVNDIDYIDSQRTFWHEEEKATLQKYHEICRLRELRVEGYSLVVKTGGAKTPQEKKQYKSMLSRSLLRHPAKSFQGGLHKLVTMANYHLHTGDYEKKHDAMSNIIVYLESYPHQIEESMNTYFGSILELAYISVTAKKFRVADFNIQKLKSIYQKNENELTLKNKLMFLHTETYLLLDKGEFAAALPLIPKMSRLIATHYKQLDPMEELLQYYLCFDVYFRNRDYQQAQFYIQKIINDNSDIRLDIQSSARIANLILQFEQKEYEYMGYVLRSTYHFLFRKQRLHEPEKIILHFLKKAIKLTSRKEVIQSLADFKKQLLPYAGDPLILNFPLPLIEWIESKLQKKDLNEIVREKYLRAIG